MQNYYTSSAVHLSTEYIFSHAVVNIKLASNHGYISAMEGSYAEICLLTDVPLELTMMVQVNLTSDTALCTLVTSKLYCSILEYVLCSTLVYSQTVGVLLHFLMSVIFRTFF